MLQNVEFSSRPDPFTLETRDGETVITLADNVREVAATEDKPASFLADLYIIKQPETPNMQQRISDGLAAFLAAAKATDSDETAKAIRARRDELLAEVDKHGTIFRMGLEAPSGSTFTAWLSFLRKIGDYLAGTWANYRQLLLDVPQQQGFPYNVTWPDKPADGDE